MSDRAAREAVWAMAAAERRALAEDLAGLSTQEWAAPSLCGRWRVEEVVAHLTAAASIGPLRWIRSVLGARFDFDLHNQRRLEERLGPDPAGTLARFREIFDSSTCPPGGGLEAWLGEVVIHAQTIRRPLGSSREPAVTASTAVAGFFATRDFTVPGKSMAAGLRLEATDGPFTAGAGPLVRGSTIALVMALATRPEYLDDLTGDGVAELRSRVNQVNSAAGRG